MHPAHALHAKMKSAVHDYKQAEQNLVVLFAELLRTNAHRRLGYTEVRDSMHAEFGFSHSKTRQFVLLAKALETLPPLKQAVQNQELDWTVAVDVARTATPQSASAWVERAKEVPRAQLRQEIRAAKQRPVAELPLMPPARPRLATMTDIHLRLDAIQLERYERALERLRARGQKDIESILTGLELQLEGSQKPAASVCRQTLAETLIVLHDCPSCEEAHVKSARGDRALRPPQRAAAHCDATIQRAGERTRTIPPRVRRQTLERDGYRCRRCKTARSLQVHHLHEKQFGGGHQPENLLTLCRACHEQWHELGMDVRTGLLEISER